MGVDSKDNKDEGAGDQGLCLVMLVMKQKN